MPCTAGEPPRKPESGDVARLFTAVWPDHGMARAILAMGQECMGLRGSQTIAADRIHLTLNFLGDVPRHRIAELIPALRVPFQPFELQVSRCGMWRRGLVVATPDTPALPLLVLQGTLDSALQRLGLLHDKRTYHPHITLARHQHQALALTAGQPLHWWVDHYVLVESHAAARGAYEILHRYGHGSETERPSVTPAP